uniref:Flavin-containing monooxygenase n=1 Tax=Lepisosteus oculatus TaxID=7918 RepID=W5MWD4_LEPOC
PSVYLRPRPALVSSCSPASAQPAADGMVRRVAVIGAGPSGLVSIKSCLEEGLEPVCFESSDAIGGMWRFKEKPEPGRASIYRSLVVNTSKEMMCFSDFPFPAHFPNYMQSSRLLEYYCLYAEHFQLLPHIRFQTTVLSVKQRPDFSRSGQWEVLTVDREGQEESFVFDGVLVCTGHYTQPALPLGDFPGIATFEGQHFHGWEYKDPDKFRGKRVMVVGMGNSGGDIAVEMSRVAEQTFLSTRKGAWVVSRASDRGMPLDMTKISRIVGFLTEWLPACLVNWLWERTLNQKYDHSMYGLQSQQRVLKQRPLINDDLPCRILLGALVMKPHVREFRGSSVVFEDGTVEDGIDAVVFCTGYKYSFPFLPASLFAPPGQQLALYKHLFPPALQPPTLAVVGLFQASGPIMPIAEMQVRWATRVIAGLNKLPTEETMLKDIECETKRMERRYTAKLAPLQVDYIPYLDSLAAQIGARPSLMGLLLRDPRLGLSVLLGPCTPYQYRL